MFIILLLIQLSIMFFLNLLGLSSEVNAYIFMVINMLYLVILFQKKYSDISIYLLIGYFVRILFMLWDLYARHILTFPGSGGDSEGFYRVSVMVSNNLQLLEKDIYGGLYTKTLGLIFYFTGENRILGQYINVMLGMAIIILIYKSIKMLNIKKRNINVMVLIISLFPNALIFSAILLRENFITFFVTLSLYYFIKWYMEGKFKNQLLSIIFILLASSFHSGVIGILVGYVFTFILYNRNINSFRISVKSIIIGLIFIFLGIAIINQSDAFLAKFKNLEEIDDIIGAANYRIGESTYLTSLKLNSLWQIILYSPIYTFYFLTSPLPLNWRGVKDIVTFIIDSSLYLVIIFTFIKKIKDRKKLTNNKDILLSLSVSAMTTIFIFAIGVQNAGTAMRHRHKILPLLIIILAILQNEKGLLKKDSKE